MKSRYFDITTITFIVMLFSKDVNDATGRTVDLITLNTSNIFMQDEFYLKRYDNDCECIKYNCGCCQYIEWDMISLNGKLCINATYLDKDYGFSLTITYNNFPIFNETVSLRNPPPICFGEDVIESLDIDVCLRIYNIDINDDQFHACFNILGRIMKHAIIKKKLGCIQIKLSKEFEYLEYLYKNISVLNTNAIHEANSAIAINNSIITILIILLLRYCYMLLLCY